MDIADVLQHTSADLFLPDLQSKEKEPALSEMVDGLISGTPIKNKETILQMLLSRENLGSTAVGPGIAFPHGRTLAVQKLTILIALSRKGLAFGSDDGQPTHLFIMLLAPPQDSGHQYIQSLAALTLVMQDEKLRQAAMRAEDYDSFCAALQEG
jgi:mannitol/fructose-specific phosphotransferase system IIA component (Ntr-type)